MQRGRGAGGHQVPPGWEQRGAWDPCLRPAWAPATVGWTSGPDRRPLSRWKGGSSPATWMGFCFPAPAPGRGGRQSWLQALSPERAISIRTRDEETPDGQTEGSGDGRPSRRASGKQRSGPGRSRKDPQILQPSRPGAKERWGGAAPGDTAAGLSGPSSLPPQLLLVTLQRTPTPCRAGRYFTCIIYTFPATLARYTFPRSSPPCSFSMYRTCAPSSGLRGGLSRSAQAPPPWSPQSGWGSEAMNNNSIT